MLRAKIQKIIEKATSPEDAAYLICFLMEDEIGGLNANGKFDNDPDMQTQLEHSCSAMAERIAKFLA
jgi:hypothetical protein